MLTVFRRKAVRTSLADLGRATTQTKGPTPMVGLDSVSGQYWDQHAPLAD
ncbi:lasso peptide astexin 3 [Asticcacaulis sp. DW145]|nr:lasso peptide astexin 3 [Asticcacaulis sp. DW145]